MKRVRILEGDSPQDATWIKTRVTPQSRKKVSNQFPTSQCTKMCDNSSAILVSQAERKRAAGAVPAGETRSGEAEAGARRPGRTGQVRADVLADPSAAAAQPRRLPAAR